MTANTAATTLADRLWQRPQDRAGSSLRQAALVLCGVALLAASAKAQLPMVPVPMTMQSAVVMLIAVGFGLRLGMATVAAYLALGFLGAPVFAGALAGPLYFAGPTGGFLIGFVLATGALGLLADRGWNRGGKLLFALALGSAVPFVAGWAWLATLSGAEAAFAAGVLPFLPGALLKLALVFLLLTVAQRATTR